MSIQFIEGETKVPGAKVGIIVARWNSMITEKLLDGAIAALKGNGVNEDDITVVRCPGAFELPLTGKLLMEQKELDGVIAIGVVIRGGTPHFEYVCDAVTNGVLALNMDFGIPVAFGVLTTDDVKQALERSGDDGNKGAEAALALLEMMSVSKNLEHN